MEKTLMTSPVSIVPQPRIEAAIRQAARATGTDFEYLLDTAVRESGLKASAKSRTSSATGLFQFIEQTWLDTVKKAGHLFGYDNLSDAIETTPGGRHKVSDPALRQAILSLRKDPAMASLMAGAHARESAEFLENRIGRPPVAGELYMAHFLGQEGAAQLISAARDDPNLPADRLFPRAARANRPIFYDRAGHARSVAQVRANLIAVHGDRELNFAEPGSLEAAAGTAASVAGQHDISPAAVRAAPGAIAGVTAPARAGEATASLIHSLFIAPFTGDRLLDADRAAHSNSIATDRHNGPGGKPGGEFFSQRHAINAARARGFLAKAHVGGADTSLTHSLFLPQAKG